ncbi:hypothetical protein ElyMa_004765300 [Elysia marginata]|uniref:Uncharacterized protein n=1 Tax=Elysia marginata TaxID=1093978 RepID=A0AAV4IHZ1_9GAST|nr:hypothetical protein ElyMa_004765300 [Elysia marginata]
MSDSSTLGSTAGTSSRQGLFELFENGSDIEDDFDVPHLSDDSGTSSEEEMIEETRSRSDEPAQRLADEFGWTEVDLEHNRARIDPNFVVRNAMSAQNINFEITKQPIHFFLYFSTMN